MSYKIFTTLVLVFCLNTEISVAGDSGEDTNTGGAGTRPCHADLDSSEFSRN